MLPRNVKYPSVVTLITPHGIGHQPSFLGTVCVIFEYQQPIITMQYIINNNLLLGTHLNIYFSYIPLPLSIVLPDSPPFTSSFLSSEDSRPLLLVLLADMPSPYTLSSACLNPILLTANRNYPSDPPHPSGTFLL